MAIICDELREYAAQCRALGQNTTAGKLEGAAEWIDIQQQTIREQKAQITELKRRVPDPDRVRPSSGINHTGEQVCDDA